MGRGGDEGGLVMQSVGPEDDEICLKSINRPFVSGLKLMFQVASTAVATESDGR